MKCPSCNVNLLMSEKKGVEIDYCPECRGIWLDKGELEKLIEADKKAYDEMERDYQDHSSSRGRDQRDDYSRDRDYDKDYDKRYKKRKRGGMFSEIGDIFDF